MFTKVINALASLIKYLSILFLLLIACYVLVARASLYYLPDYQDQIAQFLTEKLNTSIKFDSISSQWEGFDPVLKVHGLTVEGDNQLSIALTSLNFSFLQSVLNLQPKFDRIIIERANISLTQQHDGHWQILNFDSSDQNIDTNKNDKVDLELLSIFNGTTINIKELSASIFNETGKLRKLSAPIVNVNYKDDQLFASGQLLESTGDKTLLNFSLKGRNLFTDRQLKGTVFVEARSSEIFGELLSVYDWQNISIQDIEASSRAWVNFEGFNVSSIHGDLQIREMNWRVDEGSLAPVNNLALTYLWQRDKSRKKLSIDNFAFEWAGLECEPINLTALFLEERVNVEADKIGLHCVTQLLLSMGILPTKLEKRLAISEPKGYLRNIHFYQEYDDIHHEDKSDDSPDFEFEAILSDVSVQAYESTPSAKNIEGYVFANNDSGFVSFLSEDFELGFPTLFLDPFELRRAEGVVSWDIRQDDITISSDGLRLWRDQESLVYGDFILRLNDELTEDYLSLALGMQDILFPEVIKFVPYHAVEHGLYSWLSDSLIAGSVSSGVYYGYGSVDTVSAPNSFTSSVYLESNEGVLMFDEEWPALENINADIVIQNSEVWIDSKKASIAGTLLQNVNAYLPKGEPKQANFINLSANSVITKELIDYWLVESPISDKTKHIAQQLEINNGAQVSIDLRVPVSQDESSEKIEELSYLVSTKIIDGAITHKPSNLNFKSVNGVINVDSTTGVTAKSIQANLFDEPVDLSIRTDFRAIDGSVPAEQITKLFLQGDLGLEQIFTYFDSTTPDFIKGKFGYLAELTISDDENKYPLLTVNTDLMGVDCLCPAPFTKASTEQQTLQLSLLLKPDQLYLEGNVESLKAPDIDMELLFVGEELTFGEFRVGGAKVVNTDIKGINIAAQLEDAELGAWIDFLQNTLKSDSGGEVRTNSALTLQNSEPNSQKPSIIRQIQLDINNLDAFDYLLQESSLTIRPSEDSWKINIEGQDIIGNVLLSDSEGKLNLEFEKLNLSQPVQTNNIHALSVNTEDNDVNPSSFPLLSFKAKNLLLDNRSIGSWQFDLTPDDSGSTFQNIKGHIKGSNITGQLNWRYSSGVQNTIATLSSSGEDIASIFKVFDLPEPMTSSRYSADLALVWPDSPSNFSLAQLSGNIRLSLEEGFLKTEDQKTGILRLFGVLNAESIKRRLKLDFTDLYKSGVGYDTFDAKASMDQGLMTLTEPLIIDGPAGKYTLNGRSDLATKALDIDMLVELPFTQNMPLAALVLGAPQIGGLVWVADKLLGEPLSALTTSRYDISGTWDKPRVDLKQAMNASKKDRTNEKGTRNVGKPEK